MAATACASPNGGSGGPGSGSNAGTFAITNVTVIDVVAAAERPGMTVVVRNGRIAAMGSEISAPSWARRVDGIGRFLIPGLWDMHAHHQAVGEASLPLFIANGVVGTRDMGSDADFILPLRRRVEAGELPGPAIIAAGPILDAAPASWPFRQRVTGAEDARAAVRSLHRREVDFIKVHDQTPRDAYLAIARESRRLGLPFAGHVPASITIEEASRSGQASIEHLANFRVFIECAGDAPYARDQCAGLYGRLAANHVWQTPTLAFMETVPDLMSGTPPPHAEYASAELRRMGEENREASNLTPEAIAWFRAQGRTALVAVADMRDAGVQFLAGCDALVPGFCLHDELEWLTRAGLSPLEALRAATINPALFLGSERHEGSIAAGKNANLVLLDASPLADIRNTRRIHAVVLRGRLYLRAELDAILAAARAL